MEEQTQWWRQSWRQCWSPVLSLDELQVLADALAADDARLIQGRTVHPPGRPDQIDHNCLQACALGVAVWLSRGPLSCRQVIRLWEDRYAAAELHASGNPHLPWYFVVWYDDHPWDDVRSALLSEVQRSLALRLRGEADPEPVVVLIAT